MRDSNLSFVPLQLESGIVAPLSALQVNRWPKARSAYASVMMHTTPSVFRISRVAAIEPSTSMPPAGVLDDDNLETFAGRVLGGVTHAKIVSESGHKNPREATIAKMATRPVGVFHSRSVVFTPNVFVGRDDLVEIGSSTGEWMFGGSDNVALASSPSHCHR
jgi:hypothetical protein